jgi:hypothetical protein
MAVGCARCSRVVARDRLYLSEGGQACCLGCALRDGGMLVGALRVSLVVGTILTAINQGDVLLAEPITAMRLLKVLLTYAVPFGVSVYSMLRLRREWARRRADAEG